MTVNGTMTRATRNSGIKPEVDLWKLDDLPKPKKVAVKRGEWPSLLRLSLLALLHREHLADRWVASEKDLRPREHVFVTTARVTPALPLPPYAISLLCPLPPFPLAPLGDLRSSGEETCVALQKAADVRHQENSSSDQETRRSQGRRR